MAIAGCGGGKDAQPTGRVSGKVTVQGQPVAKGTVTLEMKGGGAAASAAVGADGSFTVAEPLAVGTYTVSVAPPEPSPDDAPTPGGAAIAAKTNIPQKYRSSSTSDLTAEVKAGDNPPLTLDLKP